MKTSQSPEEPVTVFTHDGHKHPEKPRSFVYKGSTYNVEEIISRSVEETAGDRYRTFRFQVKCDPPLECFLTYHPETQTWYLFK